MLLHLVLLSLALFCVYEIALTYLPKQPGIVIVAGLLALGYLGDRFVPDHYLVIAAAASLVAMLDRHFRA